MAGVVKIAANTFEDIGGGQVKAAGNVVLGDFLSLTGVNDFVVYNNSTLSGNVTLALKANGQQLDLFSGALSVPLGSGKGSPGPGVTYKFAKLGGFPVASDLTITQIDIAAGKVSGNASINTTIKGVTTSAKLNYTLTASPSLGIS